MEPPQMYNGVFKGGGAKGIAYAGALEACEQAGVRFASVAGSSAGAITSCLVAAGYTAKQIAGLVPDGLGALEKPTSALVRPRSGSLLRNDRLRNWLEEALSKPVRGDGPHHSPITFHELFEHSGIELFVVGMDLSSRQPLVFGSHLTPNVSVASAVVASSAIPVAFPAVRMVLDDQIHRIVDGGTWANYPSFVYLDRDFREHHALDAGGEDSRCTIGFILDDDDAENPADAQTVKQAVGRDDPTDRGSAISELGAAGALLSSVSLRVALLAIPAFVIAAIVLLLASDAGNDFELTDAFPAWLHSPLIVATGALIAVSLPLAVGGVYVIARLGRPVLDGGVVGAIAAMGVGPSVPYWVRQRSGEQRHLPIRIRVPAALTTLSFGADVELVNDAVVAGFTDAARTLTAAEIVPPEWAETRSVEPLQLDADSRLGTVEEARRGPLLWRMVRGLGRLYWAVASIFSRPVFGLLSRLGVPADELEDVFKSSAIRIWLAILVAMGLGGSTTLLIDGAPLLGLLLLFGMGLVLAAGVWRLAVLGAQRSGEPFQILRRLPSGAPVTLGIISLLGIAVFLPLIFSFPSAAHVATAAPHAGVVVERTDDALGILVVTADSDVEFVAAATGANPTALRAAMIEAAAPGHTATKSAENEDLLPCTQVASPQCRFYSTTAPTDRIGATVTVLIHEDGIALLERERGGSLYFALLLPPFVAVMIASFITGLVRCIRFLRWKRATASLRTLPPPVAPAHHS